ncbi:MAG TPA: BPL-N domain-containing protein [Methanobacterium sp.]
MAQNGSNSKNTNTVTKVLIFNGSGVMESSVDGIVDCLNDSNNQNISKNNKFQYSTTTVINSNTLSGYDVLIMPGGEASDYIDSDDIDSQSIKQFVQNGNGYIGICAGAYAASNYVSGEYSGWGLAPEVTTFTENYEGLLQISRTDFGSKILNSSLTDIHIQNGPAMATNNSQIIMATFADNNTGYQNYAAIIGDTYGSGRVILSGPHPEMNPENPQLLTNMVLWVSKKL